MHVAGKIHVLVHACLAQPRHGILVWEGQQTTFHPAPRQPHQIGVVRIYNHQLPVLGHVGRYNTDGHFNPRCVQHGPPGRLLLPCPPRLVSIFGQQLGSDGEGCGSFSLDGRYDKSRMALDFHGLSLEVVLGRITEEHKEVSVLCCLGLGVVDRRMFVLVLTSMQCHIARIGYRIHFEAILLLVYSFLLSSLLQEYHSVEQLGVSSRRCSPLWACPVQKLQHWILSQSNDS